MALYIFNIDCPHIPNTTHYFDKERTTTMKIHFAYYNQYKNGIDIAFADNTLLFLSCAEAEKNLHTTLTLKGLLITLQLIILLYMLHLLLIVSCRLGLMLWMRITVSKYFINILHLYSFLVVINSVLPYSVGG